MTNSDRARVILHGGVVLLVGLLCGYPTVAETIGAGESERLWHTAHEGLIMMGVLLLVIAAAVMPSLVLQRREAAGLVWALLATGYGFMIGLVLGGIFRFQAFGPSRSPLVMIAFLGNSIGIFGSVVAAALTIMGAGAALKRSGEPSV